MPKVVFLDLDGTVISHETNEVPESAKKAIKLLKENGHLPVIATGRVPCLFDGIEETLEIDTFIAANGRIVEHNGEVILNHIMDKTVVKAVVDMAYKNKIDVAFENRDNYVLNSNFTDLPQKFNDVFHIELPEVKHNFHLENDVHQIVLFYTKSDFKRFEKDFPSLNFSYSNQYGIDVNTKGGMKDFGVKALLKHLNIPKEDAIAIGDGFNDISMIEYCGIGVAMGNAQQLVKEKADIIADRVENDGLFNVLKQLKLI